MYIKEVEIKNIKSISNFSMKFDNPAGWHVILGDNGAGKTSIVRAIALALLDQYDINASNQVWDEWLTKDERQGSVELFLNGVKNQGIQQRISFQREIIDRNSKLVTNSFSTYTFIREIVFRGEIAYDYNSHNANISSGSLSPSSNITSVSSTTIGSTIAQTTTKYIGPPIPTPPSEVIAKLKEEEKFFSASFGAYRRFTGGNAEKEKLYVTRPNLGAHLSIFSEDVALTEALNSIKELLDVEKQEIGNHDYYAFAKVIKFINQSELLPHGVKIEEIDKKNILFRDGEGKLVDTLELSDGYRSMLSLMFELIRQLARIFGIKKVFEHVEHGNCIIDLEGVVIIDEIDVHLHPSWQTKIGRWFIKYFPKMQFIVTTHSPLICWSSANGTIWKVAAPGEEQKSGLLSEDDRNKLIYGNILDAYGTDVFGKEPSRNVNSTNKKLQMIRLSKKQLAVGLSAEEENVLNELRKIFSTDDSITE